MTCCITIIRAHGRRLAKLVNVDSSIIDFDNVMCFNLIDAPIADLAALYALLERLQSRQDCAIVRGSITRPFRTFRVRRLLHADQMTGHDATLRYEPRSWVALDLDGIPAPAGLDLFDLLACGQTAIDALPAAFHGAACIVAATGSHTFKPGLRLRLWFWLSRPMNCAQLKRWLYDAPVDRSVFNAAQAVYVADPVFVGGVDPLPLRLETLPGGDAVTPPPLERAANASGQR